METRTWTIKFPKDGAVLQRLKDRHAETFNAHRLSFNAWLVSCIMESTQMKEEVPK